MQIKFLFFLINLIICLPVFSQNRALTGGSGNTGPTPNLNQGDYVIYNTTLDLNLGGVIYDVAYNNVKQFYVIVGDFTSVNGKSRGNIAVLDSNLNVIDFSNYFQYTYYGVNFTNLSSIASIDGPIKTVAILNGQSIYFGGEFTSFSNGTVYNRGYMAEFALNGTSYNVSGFNPNFDARVNDILFKQGTMLVAGDFYQTNTTTREHIAAFDVFNNQLIAGYPAMATSNLYFRNSINSLTIVGGSIYASLTGAGKALVKLDAAGEVDLSFNSSFSCNTYWSPCSNSSGKCVRYNDSSVFFIADRPPTQGNSLFYDNWGISFPVGRNTLTSGSIDSYKEEIHYTYSDDGVRGYRKDTLTFLASSVANNTNPIKTLVRVNNKLFVSSPGLTNIGGVNRVGLAVLCLEPENAKLALEGDTLTCPGRDSLVYRIAPVANAAGYYWNYTGNGCSEFSSNTPLSINDSIITSTSEIRIGFDNNFTTGQLKVTPVSDCGITSNTFTFNIGAYPLPTVFAGIDTTLNCIRDTVVLIGSSTTLNVTTEWLNSPFPSIMGTIDTIVNAGQYVFRVTDAIGCYNSDTVVVTLDTVKPVANPIPGPYDLTCAITSRIFTGTSLDSTNSISWRYSGNLYTNPVTVNSIGTYRLIVTDIINGCADSSQAAIVNLDITPPDLGILNRLDYLPYENLETITCINDSINLITAPIDTNGILNINAIANWTNADSSLLFGDSLAITASGTYYITAIDTLNGCSIYKQVLIDADTTKPNVILPISSNLTCSLDSVTLTGSSSVSPTTLEWTGANIQPSPNPGVVNSQGVYYLTVTKDSSGCSLTDSITVGFTPEINVFAGNDTTVCNNSIVSLNVQYVGNSVTGVNYLWDNGTTNAVSNYTGGISSYAIVEVFGNNSCYGTDTVFINIPPIPTSDFQSFQPCASDTDGKIIANVLGGWAPFTYSIDVGATFQNSPIFPNLMATTYSIIVRDSLGCDYIFSATIDANSNLPKPLFLVSTNNFVSDTVVLVDVSSPPADSTSWVFPVEIEILDSNSLSPVVILPDTGSFEIIMTAYFGNCDISISKWVNSAEFDSTFANHTNQNGIKSIVLYPNPNDGNFNLEIEFFKKQQAVITIQDISGNTYVNNQYFEVDAINEYIQLNSPVTGTYILKVVSEYDSGYITFIINQ